RAERRASAYRRNGGRHPARDRAEQPVSGRRRRDRPHGARCDEQARLKPALSDNSRVMTCTRAVAGLLTGLLLPIVVIAQGASARPDPASPTAERLPIYEVDPTWPPTLPNDWILGDIRGLFVDDRDHLWVIHMPSSLTPQEIGAAVKPPIADCCVPAPPVLELDSEGKVLRAWGGPGDGYTWFDQEHGIYIDHNGFVWMGTSNGTHVMKFTQDGKHVLTIGEPGVNKGSNDPDHLGGP